MNELSIEAKIENLDIVQGFIGERLADCPIKTQTQIAVAVDEVFSNICRYAYDSETGGAVVRIAVGELVTVEFEDSGVPYNPLLKEDPDITQSAGERGIGGLGIYMVKTMMDCVEYRHEGARNILTIQKKLS